MVVSHFHWYIKITSVIDTWRVRKAFKLLGEMVRILTWNILASVVSAISSMVQIMPSIEGLWAGSSPVKVFLDADGVGSEG